MKSTSLITLLSAVLLLFAGCSDAEQQLNDLFADNESAEATTGESKADSATSTASQPNTNSQDSQSASTDSQGAGAMALTENQSSSQTYANVGQAIDAAVDEMKITVLSGVARQWITSLDLSEQVLPPLFDLSSLDSSTWGRCDLRFQVGQIVSTNSATGTLSVGRNKANVILGNIDTSQLKPRQSIAIPNQILISRGVNQFSTYDGQSGSAPYVVIATVEWNTILKHVHVYQREVFDLEIDEDASITGESMVEDQLPEEDDAASEKSDAIEEAKRQAIETGELSEVLTDEGFRTWMAGTDQAVVAKLSKLSGEVTKLEKLDGEIVEIQKSDLLDEDREFITKWIRSR